MAYRAYSYSSVSKHYTLRMILVGEAGAGKSSLYHRIKYKSFRDDPEEDSTGQTVSTVTSRARQYDTYTRNIALSNKDKVSLTVVDTASKERLQTLTAQYYRRANIVVFVCSLDNETTLNKLTKWFAETQDYIDDPDVVYALVGMKSDLPEHAREITNDMLHGFATHYNISRTCVFEVSAKNGSGVKSLLKTLCSMAIDQYLVSLRGRHSSFEKSDSPNEVTHLVDYARSSSPDILRQRQTVATLDKSDDCQTACCTGRCRCVIL